MISCRQHLGSCILRCPVSHMSIGWGMCINLVMGSLKRFQQCGLLSRMSEKLTSVNYWYKCRCRMADTTTYRFKCTIPCCINMYCLYRSCTWNGCYFTLAKAHQPAVRYWRCRVTTKLDPCRQVTDVLLYNVGLPCIHIPTKSVNGGGKDGLDVSL